MTLHARALPALDGTRPATDARLGAWLESDHTEAADHAIHEARAHLEEAKTIAAGMKAEPCSSDDCVALNTPADLDFLRSELDDAATALDEAESAVEDIDQAAGAA